MKKLLCLLAISLSLQVSGFSQEPGTTPTNSENYLKKSQSQKTSAWVLLGGGAALATGGLMIGMNNLDIFSEENNSDYELGMGMFWVGSAAMLSSIPLFIASARNKGRALSASAYIKLEDYQAISRDGFTKANYPALSLRLNIK